MRILRSSVAFGIGRDLAVAILVCAAVLLVSLSLQLTATEQELRRESLQRAARYVEQNVQTDPSGRMRLPATPGSSWASFGYPTLVFDSDGRTLLERPAELEPAVISALFRAGQAALREPDSPEAIHFFRLEIGESRIIGAALRTGTGRDTRLIEVFKDENAPDVLVDDVVREFPYRRARVQLPLLGLLVLVTAWIVRRRIRPIAEVSRIAGTIGPQTLDMRLPERNLPAEVQPIVHAVNGAFERLDRGAAAQREFLRRAAHQLRTPLTVLSARAETLDDSETTSQLRADIREIARMITQLLQLNELDALPEHGASVADLGAVGEAVRGELRTTAARGDRRIDLVQPDRPVLVRGDPNVIEIAVHNLVENAIRHSPPGGTIGIRIEHAGQIEVANAGSIIPDGLQDKIFEPFWSGDPDGRQPGLGLTIVRRIAERCGAAITVRSAPDFGTVFTLAFQMVPQDAGQLDPAEVSRSIPAGLALRRQDRRIDETAS